MLDTIKGGLFGVAIGDAMGATTEFMTKEEIKAEYGKVTDILGGGVWGLKQGETTDDTDMTLAVLKGIMANSTNPIDEIGKQFLVWAGTNPKDIGITIRAVFDNYEGDWFKAAEKTHVELDGKSAGNGSLMRCLPVALAYSDIEKMEEITQLQSSMTHFDELAAEACVIYNRIAWRLLKGEDLFTSIGTEIKNTRYESNYDQEPTCPPDGYVVHTMKWVLYWLLNSDTFEEVVVGATNMGHDSDTVAAIAGGLKGLEVGFNQLPDQFSRKLKLWNELRDYAEILNEIRDKDTVLLQKRTPEYLVELEKDANRLYEHVETKPIQDDSNEILESIRKRIFLIRLSLNEDQPNFRKQFETWWGAKMRYRRTKRLVDLGAPSIVIQNEIRWILIMIDHLNKRFQGIEPQFTQEQLEELESLAEVERAFE